MITTTNDPLALGPPPSEAVYAALLSYPASRPVYHEYPGYLDVPITPFFSLGFDDSAWDMFVLKTRPEATELYRGRMHLLHGDELLDPYAVANAIMRFCGLFPQGVG